MLSVMVLSTNFMHEHDIFLQGSGMFVCCQMLNKTTDFASDLHISVSGILSGDKTDQSCASA